MQSAMDKPGPGKTTFVSMVSLSQLSKYVHFPFSDSTITETKCIMLMAGIQTRISTFNISTVIICIAESSRIPEKHYKILGAMLVYRSNILGNLI
ncbi:hypothetical protein VULLAG_LOCUS21850 [Vulpes lagopus]